MTIKEMKEFCEYILKKCPEIADEEIESGTKYDEDTYIEVDIPKKLFKNKNFKRKFEGYFFINDYYKDKVEIYLL